MREALPDATFQTDRQQLLSLDGKFHRQLVEHLLRIAVDDQPDGILGRKPPLIAIKELILPDLRRGRLVLDDGRAVAHLDIGKRVRPAPVADKQRVALRVVARPLGLGRYLDQSPVAVLADAGRNTLADDPAARIAAR